MSSYAEDFKAEVDAARAMLAAEGCPSAEEMAEYASVFNAYMVKAVAKMFPWEAAHALLELLGAQQQAYYALTGRSDLCRRCAVLSGIADVKIGDAIIAPGGGAEDAVDN